MKFDYEAVYKNLLEIMELKKQSGFYDDKVSLYSLVIFKQIRKQVLYFNEEALSFDLKMHEIEPKEAFLALLVFVRSCGMEAEYKTHGDDYIEKYLTLLDLVSVDLIKKIFSEDKVLTHNILKNKIDLSERIDFSKRIDLCS